MMVESNILFSTHLYISSYDHCYFHFICNNIFQLSSLLSSHVYVISSNFHNCLHLMCTCYLPTVITVFISCVRDISPLSLLPSNHVFASYHSPIMAFYGVLHFVYVPTIRLFSLKAVFEVVWTCLSTITCPQQVSTALPTFTFWYLHMPIWCSCLVNFISFASPRSFPQALLILHLHVSYCTKVMTAFSFLVFKYLTVCPSSVFCLFDLFLTNPLSAFCDSTTCINLLVSFHLTYLMSMLQNHMML